MKNIFKIAACLSIATLAYSCALDEIDSQMTDAQAIASIRLECDALETYTIQAEKPQAISFSVSSTTPWSITGIPAWLSVSPASSAESSLSEDIVIKAEANPEYQDRTASLTVKGENTDILYTLTITQLRKGKLVVTPVASAFPTAGGSLPFKVLANLAWEVTAADSWLSFSETSGVGDDSEKTIQATAEKNTSVVRETTVSVTSGDQKIDFQVTQNGQTLEFKPLASTEFPRLGGEVEIGVNASMEWKVEVSDPFFTATKSGDDKIVLSAPFNNKFAPRSVTVSIKPVDTSFGNVSSTVELTQDINFSFQGHCEVLADGSVKVYGDGTTVVEEGKEKKIPSRVQLLDGFKYVSMILKMGDKHFGDKAEMWLYANDAVEGVEIEIQNQIQLGKRVRVRLNGDLPNSGLSSYDSVDYEITQAELNAMNEYRVDILPSENSTSGVGHLKFSFSYNGTLRSAVLDKPSIFEDEPTAACHYWFGCYNLTTDGTWYVVKTCDVVSVAK